MLVKTGRLPERGECGIVRKAGGDGRLFCAYRSGAVTPEKCASCERGPSSIRKDEDRGGKR